MRDHPAVAKDAGAWANGYFAQARDEAGATHDVVGAPIRMSATPLAPLRASARTGRAHRGGVAGGGDRAAEIAALRESGTI